MTLYADPFNGTPHRTPAGRTTLAGLLTPPRGSRAYLPNPLPSCAPRAPHRPGRHVSHPPPSRTVFASEPGIARDICRPRSGVRSLDRPNIMSPSRTAVHFISDGARPRRSLRAAGTDAVSSCRSCGRGRAGVVSDSHPPGRPDGRYFPTAGPCRWCDDKRLQRAFVRPCLERP